MLEWKGASGHLEEATRKVNCQDEINMYFRELGELEKAVTEKELWLKDISASSTPKQHLTAVKESCQVILANLVFFWLFIRHN